MKPIKLTREEEREAALAWQQNKDVRGRDRLVASVIKLIQGRARSCATRETPMEDLFQEGVLAAMRAADTFDPDRNLPFVAYAVPWIKQAISRVRDSNRLSMRGGQRWAGVKHAAKNEELARVRMLSLEDLQTDLDVPQEGRQHTFKMLKRGQLDALSFNPDVEDKIDAHLLFNRAGLTDEEREVLAQRFGPPEGRAFTPKARYRIQKRAMAKLRKAVLKEAA
jgi:RNA polymerase primary sigma factor